jgi:translin
MDLLDNITEKIRLKFEARTRARDEALGQARSLTRHAANAIRAIHRGEQTIAHEHLQDAKELAALFKTELAEYPDLYYAGYTQDALKEYCEACITVALIENQLLPDPDSLGQEYATYLNGLAEATGELRRRCLDILRQGYSQEAERLLTCMDDIYAVLVTLDFPDAITNGLRRQTDLVRGIVERTRADLTLALRQQHLEQDLEKMITQLNQPEGNHADGTRL